MCNTWQEWVLTSKCFVSFAIKSSCFVEIKWFSIPSLGINTHWANYCQTEISWKDLKNRKKKKKTWSSKHFILSCTIFDVANKYFCNYLCNAVLSSHTHTHTLLSSVRTELLCTVCHSSPQPLDASAAISITWEVYCCF